MDLIRIPKLKPSTARRPILPNFDIHIGDLRIDRLNIGPQVGGKARSGRVRGKADVHSGRALIEVLAQVDNGGDRIAFHLDAEPDRNKFDVAARVIALVRSGRSISRLTARAAGRAGAAMRRWTCRGARQRGWRSASTTGAIACRAE